MCKKYLVGGVNSQELGEVNQILTSLRFIQKKENGSLFYHDNLGYLEIGKHDDINETLELIYYHNKDSDKSIGSIALSVKNLKTTLEADLKPFKEESLEKRSESSS